MQLLFMLSIQISVTTYLFGRSIFSTRVLIFLLTVRGHVSHLYKAALKIIFTSSFSDRK
jgi:hypothetical protein